ncbi:MAG: hypothetical protein ABFS12_09140 [Bacteroidota bacterium]
MAKLVLTEPFYFLKKKLERKHRLLRYFSNAIPDLRDPSRITTHWKNF